MREGDRLQPLCGKFLKRGGDGAIRGWRLARLASQKRVARRKGAPLPNLNLDETRGKHASSIFGVSTREAARKAPARSLAIAAKCDAERLRRNARPHDDEHPKAALRYDAPNPRAAPANFFCCAVAAQKRGLFARFFEGEDPRPRTRTILLSVVLGVKGLPASLRRRQVLCTLPILQPCVPRHALHC